MINSLKLTKIHDSCVMCPISTQNIVFTVFESQIYCHFKQCPPVRFYVVVGCRVTPRGLGTTPSSVSGVTFGDLETGLYTKMCLTC